MRILKLPEQHCGRLRDTVNLGTVKKADGQKKGKKNERNAISAGSGLLAWSLSVPNDVQLQGIQGHRDCHAKLRLAKDAKPAGSAVHMSSRHMS